MVYNNKLLAQHKIYLQALTAYIDTAMLTYVEYHRLSQLERAANNAHIDYLLTGERHV